MQQAFEGDQAARPVIHAALRPLDSFNGSQWWGKEVPNALNHAGRSTTTKIDNLVGTLREDEAVQHILQKQQAV